MSRVKINFPDQIPIYTIEIPVRITDLNYGNHLGNDAVLSIIHEARARFLLQYGFTELEIGGCGLIMADTAIAYKAEAFFGDTLSIELFTGELTAHSFDLLYRVTTVRSGTAIIICNVKTGMVCFDYQQRKVCPMPAGFREILGRSSW